MDTRTAFENSRVRFNWNASLFIILSLNLQIFSGMKEFVAWFNQIYTREKFFNPRKMRLRIDFPGCNKWFIILNNVLFFWFIIKFFVIYLRVHNFLFDVCFSLPQVTKRPHESGVPRNRNWVFFCIWNYWNTYAGYCRITILQGVKWSRRAYESGFHLRNKGFRTEK